MAFHVEIKRGHRHARAFNLDERRLRGTILGPWVAGRPVELGDREWLPKDCRLRILEGPELDGPNLAMGRGWDSAEHSAEDVTRRLIDELTAPSAASIAILASSEELEAEAQRMLSALGAEQLPWGELRSRLLTQGRATADAPTPARYAVLLVLGGGEPTPRWLFDAGLARGALGDGAVLVQLEQGPIPESLAGVEVLHLRPDDESSIRALGERLLGDR